MPLTAVDPGVESYAFKHEFPSWSDETRVRRGRDERLLLFGAVMDASGDAIVVIDAQRATLVHANAAACRLLVHPLAELLKLPPHVVFATPRATLASAWRALIAGERAGDTYETHHQRADESLVPVEVRCHAARVGGDWLIV